MISSSSRLRFRAILPAVVAGALVATAAVPLVALESLGEPVVSEEGEEAGSEPTLEDHVSRFLAAIEIARDLEARRVVVKRPEVIASAVRALAARLAESGIDGETALTTHDGWRVRLGSSVSEGAADVVVAWGDDADAFMSGQDAKASNSEPGGAAIAVGGDGGAGATQGGTGTAVAAGGDAIAAGGAGGDGGEVGGGPGGDATAENGASDGAAIARGGDGGDPGDSAMRGGDGGRATVRTGITARDGTTSDLSLHGGKAVDGFHGTGASAALQKRVASGAAGMTVANAPH